MKPDDSGTNYAFMNTGYDQHAWRNGISEKTWALTDNISFSLGKHYLTAGASFELEDLSNCYMRYGAGYYRYKSYEDFINKAAPIAFALTYSLTGQEKALSDVLYSQLSAYAQDEVTLSKKFKLFYGLRIDLPMYLNHRYENPSIVGYDFNGQKLSTADWPKARPMFSPRIGFHYDIFGDNTLILRGGSGLFTGRFPMIFLSKMQEGSGMLQTTVSDNSGSSELLSALAGGIRTPEEILTQIAPQFPNKFPTKPGAVNSIITIDRDFKMPQVWKSSLAMDYVFPLPFHMDMTLEGTYIKDINAIMQRDVNVIAADDAKMTRLSGADNRYRYPGNKASRIHDNITNAMVMTNSSEGYSYMLSAQLNMNPFKGLDFMAAYTYTQVKTISSNTSNQIDGAWKQEPTVDGPNYLTLHNAQYASAPHRLIAQLSYSVDYGHHFSTMVSLLYTGKVAGSYSYMVNGDLNNDGYAYDLMYIPRDESEMNFADFKAGQQSFTAAQQKEAFTRFIDGDPYLSKHRGEYAEAYAAYLPWYNRFDLRFVQSFIIPGKTTKHTIQLTADIMNIGNMFNSTWGVSQSAFTNKPIKYTKLDDSGAPVYNMSYYSQDGVNKLVDKSFVYTRNSSQCWGIQIGLRYIFN